jgi:putative ABC transport system ATP-binding protein
VKKSLRISVNSKEVKIMVQIELKNIDKVYNSGKTEFQALKDIDLVLDNGGLIAIVGPSGSGKSTMLNMITGIDRPTNGTVIIDGQRIDNMKENALAKWRGENIGIIFQFFQLFPTLTALENAMLPMDLAKKGSLKDRRKRARNNLELVGLGDKLNNLPSELSGGEQQRVAIARALANDPKIIIGDEPTGNLDSQTEQMMFKLLEKLNKQGKTVIFVTHSKELANKAAKKITILDGEVVNT